ESRRPAARLGLRLPPVLPAEPEAVSAPGRDRTGRPGTEVRRRRQRPPHRPARLPPLAKRRTSRGASRYLPPLARGSRVVPDRLLVHVRERVALGRRAATAHRAERERADVPDEHRVPIGGAILRADGRLDAPADAGAGRESDQNLLAIPTGARGAGSPRR